MYGKISTISPICVPRNGHLEEMKMNGLRCLTFHCADSVDRTSTRYSPLAVFRPQDNFSPLVMLVQRGCFRAPASDLHLFVETHTSSSSPSSAAAAYRCRVVMLPAL